MAVYDFLRRQGCATCLATQPNYPLKTCSMQDGTGASA